LVSTAGSGLGRRQGGRLSGKPDQNGKL
jgi:hypothetical protein